MGSSISSAAPIRECVDKDGKEVKPGDLIKVSRGDGKHWAVYVGGRNVVHLGPTRSGAGTGVVLKEKLEDVVKKDKWRVNNLLDNEYTPRPADVIVEKACSLVDKEMQYDLEKYNSEHFATEMRYGKPESRQLKNAITAEAPEARTGVKGRFMSLFLPFSSSSSPASIMKYFDTEKKEIKLGDLIQFFRPGYQHWAVYVGDGNIVHLQGPGSGAGTGKVVKQKLKDVVENDYHRINNLLDHKYKPRSDYDIVDKACDLVDKRKQYNLVKSNCEHFATEMRYGKPESRQVKDAAAGIAAGAGAVAGAAVGAGVAGPVGAVVGAVVGVAAVAGAKNEHLKSVERRQALKTKSK